MPDHALRLIAGDVARKRLEKTGLVPEIVRMVIGASGGPKWLVLQGLDKFLLASWLPKAPQKIDLVGSSIGGWRMAGAAHPDAARAVSAMHDHYLSFNYAETNGLQDVRDETLRVLRAWLSPEDCASIVGNIKRPLTIIVARAKGLANRASMAGELAALGAAAFGALFSKKAVAGFYDRIALHSGDAVPEGNIWRDFGRMDYPLTADNLHYAIMATGSIPGVLTPERIIPGLPNGLYRDGGFTDYHFGVPFKPDDGIVLYPHFYPYLIPGWFDKRFKSRRAEADAMSHMLLLAPSESFVSRLPGGKIPDRNDFSKIEPSDRLARWSQVVANSMQLADELADLIDNPNRLMDRLESPEEGRKT